MPTGGIFRKQSDPLTPDLEDSPPFPLFLCLKLLTWAQLHPYPPEAAHLGSASPTNTLKLLTWAQLHPYTLKLLTWAQLHPLSF